ncbi:multidrug resistance-associated protein [Mollisia scopiformis]|uniref:Multidrug resistance-associated protein n=1 Tax=Mollisia scopiformis TaxID=149040 RepID=A0A194X2N8_MOLSC|nr:multidrug resistance-associated protein [Mollisia scopiformis]KUJ14451.1 multidrug resistance-associated protein [Mollisia scopiformis]
MMLLALLLDNIAIALIAFIFVFTIPSLRSLAKGWRINKNPNHHQELYSDEDGVASTESTNEFSNKLQFIFIFVLAVIGFGLSIADTIYTAINQKTRTAGSNHHHLGIFLLVPAWALLLLQLIDASLKRAPVARFKSAISKLASCFLLVGIAWISLLDDASVVATIITSLQMASILSLVATIASIKRRPVVFRPDGKVVDQQRNVALWFKYSFQWCVDTLAAANRDKFGNSDLPAMDHATRSENATERFKNIAIKDTMPLWIQIFWVLRRQFILQWLSILFSNFFDVAPAFATLQLLQYLETRTDPNAMEPGAWKYVVGISVAAISSHIVDSRIMWWGRSDIVIPLRSILTGLMYSKVLKINDSSEPPEEESSKVEDTKTEEGQEPDKKHRVTSQSGIVNMFAVDCNAIATFGEQNTEYVNSAGKLIVTVVFLLLLIGWQSLCAGMLGIAMLFPFNKVLAERYGKKQKILMEIRDKRTTITTEVLHGIRQIKFSAAESQWAEKLGSVREEELSTLWQTRIDNLYMSIASEFTPVVLTALSLATYSWVHGNLLPSVAFTAISLFLQLDGLVSHIPFLLVTAINAKVSCDRIQNFLRLPEKPENTSPGESISFYNASISFPHDGTDPMADPFALRELNLQFPNNALSVISGPTGSGKSLLLAAILGEIKLLSGSIQVPKSSGEHYDSKATPVDWIIPTAISFVSQTPWIENATIKDNILFGLPFDPVRYEKVVEACALTQDLAMFEDGDETEVGAQGISLSGGQKWRLTLARAFYSRAGIMILDDVFSALDSHVGKYIYEHAILGELAEGRTIVLATHHTSLCLPRAKYAVRLSGSGVLEHAGLTEDLRKEGILDGMLQADDTTEPKYGEEDEVLRAEESNGATAIPSADAAVAVKATPKKLIEEEQRETGRVKTSVYAGYLHASGGWAFWSLVVGLYAVAEGFTLGRTYWIRIWASDYGKGQSEAAFSFAASHFRHTIQPRFSGQIPISPTDFGSTINSTMVSASFPIETQNRNLWFYLGVYCLISTISVVFSISRLYLVYSGSIRASRLIFKSVLYSVLRAPLRWLDTVPTGRILNRFTADFTSIDSSLAQTFYYFAAISTDITGILVAATFVSPFMIICAAALLAACTLFTRSYLTAARNVKRLDSVNKSPVISHFAASLSGLSTIRAFAKSSDFKNRMFALIDTYAASSWYNNLFRSWLMVRIGITASFFATAVSIFVITKKGIDASLAGFALSFALSFGHSVSWAIRISTQLELDMNAAERVFEYRDITIEDQDGDNIPASWPEEGRVEVKDLELGYAEGLPSILKGLSFTAEKNQRIGVIGRTGAGKSTLSLALFRFLQARKGSIVIDGIDISRIRLHDLRTRLAIIPQDPVLFSGTIRSNLDPFNEFSDYQLREALMRVHLIPSYTHTPVPEATLPDSSTASSTTAFLQPAENRNIFLSLTAPIASGGTNLSQGQKQLLCLARAILSRPKVLLLDEATSAVDMSTDLLIQRSIRDEFSNTTLLVIAHRLSTIADFDRILVLKDGVNAEFGSPKELLEKEDGLFKGMVAQSGEKDELEKIIMEDRK